MEIGTGIASGQKSVGEPILPQSTRSRAIGKEKEGPARTGKLGSAKPVEGKYVLLQVMGSAS